MSYYVKQDFNTQVSDAQRTAIKFGTFFHIELREFLIAYSIHTSSFCELNCSPDRQT
jgi:hypothetical protein